MKKLLGIFAVIISFSSFAGNNSDAVASAGFGKLSEVEKAEVIKMVAEKASKGNATASVATSVSVVDAVERWSVVGSNLGKGLGAAAKELGVAVNEFAVTPVGQLTTWLIVWHMIGAQLIHVFGGILILLFGSGVIYYIIQKNFPKIVTRSNEVRNVFGNFAIAKVENQKMDGEDAAWYLLAYVVVIIASLIVTFTF